MHDFHTFAKAIEARFRQLSQGELYTVDPYAQGSRIPEDVYAPSGIDVAYEGPFAVYLNSFPEGSNPIFKKRTTYDCACCRSFIKMLGRVVSVRNNRVETVWECEGLSEPFATVAQKMDAYVKSLPLQSIFRTKEAQYGTEATRDFIDNNILSFNHLWGKVGSRHMSNAAAKDAGEVATKVGVFRRGMEELKAEAIQTVIDLIANSALYKGAENREKVVAFARLHREYPRTASNNDKMAWLFNNLRNGPTLLRNESIGQLIINLSEGMDLETAVGKYEAMVAPENYRRPTALITPKMIEAAVETIRDLGLEGALNRRYAKLSDVSVNNVLFVDNSVRKQMKDGLTSLLMEEVKPVAATDVKNAAAIRIEDFLTNVVPLASNIDLLVEGKFLPKFVSLTAPVDPNTPQLFRWPNNFAWSYDGNLTDSSIKQKVKAAGGKVDALFRVSLAWHNYDDLDLHVREPDGNKIYFGNSRSRSGHGALDVDMNAGGPKSRSAVENVRWTKVQNGVYHVMVNQFSQRESIDRGFELEVEFNGEVRQFSSQNSPSNGVTYNCLMVTIEDGQMTAITFEKKHLVLGSVSEPVGLDKWGVKTGTLVPVNSLMASPNYWDDWRDDNAGHKHWFFILKDCVNPEPTRGIYNEYLLPRLNEHRKVFEVLADKTKCPPQAEQLSGIGFSSTRGDTAKVIVRGNRESGFGSRAFEINF